MLWVLWFAQQRWLHSDSAYTLFRILNLEPLFYDRYANELQVWPAQILAWTGAPIKWVVLTLNLSLPLFWLMGFHYWKKRSRSWFLFALLPVCGGPESFFLGYSEILFSAWCLAWIINLAETGQARHRLLFLLAGIVLMVDAHPASVLWLPLLVLLAWHNLNRQLFFASVAGFCLYFLRNLLFPVNSYDSGLIARLTDQAVWQNLLSQYSLFYIKGASKSWLIPGWISITALVWTILKNRIRVVYAFLLYAAAVLFISLVVYSRGDATILMEKFFYPFAVVCLSAWLFNSQNARFRYGLLASVMVLSAAIFFSRSLWYSSKYNNRLVALELLEEHCSGSGLHKVVVPSEKLSADTFLSHWALPYETLLVSSLNSRDTNVTVRGVTRSEWTGTKKAISNEEYLGAEFVKPALVNKLNSTYFRLPVSATTFDSSGRLLLR
ncbi:MAG: hypothetical protein JNL57_12555 [Bacteroidetes bacterium]|nr:hypothetical protein [Bacteroidota bacterium]